MRVIDPRREDAAKNGESCVPVFACVYPRTAKRTCRTAGRPFFRRGLQFYEDKASGQSTIQELHPSRLPVISLHRTNRRTQPVTRFRC